MPKPPLAFVLSAAVLFGLAISVFTLDRSVDRRIASIHTHYGIAVNYNQHGALYAHRQLDQIESALAYLGPTFTRRAGSGRAAQMLPFEIRISDERPPFAPNAVGQFQSAGESGTVHLYPSAQYIPGAYDILHEFGHAAACLSNGEVDPLSDFTRINGEYGQLDFDATRYVSRNAMSDVSEDFAEVFAFMVINGGRHPAGIGQGNLLYQKYSYMQQYLLTYLGTGSRAARQASAFLNISLDEQSVGSQAAF